MTLSGLEHETIINFNEVEDIAHVFTYNKTWQRHFEDRLGLKPIRTNNFGGKDYEVPKNWVKPPKPLKKVSEKQRQAARQTMQNIHLGRGARNDSTAENRGKIP